MPICPTLTAFANGGIIYASDHNTNNTNLRDTLNTYAVLTDVARTVSVTHIYTASQTFAGGWTAAAACTISAGGLSVTGNSTIAGALGGLTGLTVTSGGATITAGGLTVTAGGATITAGNLVLNGGQAVGKRVDDGDSGVADTIDWSAGNLHRSKLTGNCTYTFSNPATGASYVLEVLQDNAGSRTVTWPADVVWDGGVTPTLTTTGNKKDVFVFLYNGAKYLGTTYAQNVGDTT